MYVYNYFYKKLIAIRSKFYVIFLDIGAFFRYNQNAIFQKRIKIIVAFMIYEG